MADSLQSAQILTFEEINRLSDEQILERLATRAHQVRRAFIEMAKLIVVLKNRHGERFNPFEHLRVILKYDKTAVDNARYATRVWQQYVQSGAMTELRFESLTFKQCLQLDRARKDGSHPADAIEALFSTSSTTNDSATRGQKFEEYVGKLLKGKYPIFARTSPGKLKQNEKGLDFIGSFHDVNHGLVRRLGVQAKCHQATESPSELEWLRFLAGCYLQGMTEALFITTGRLTSQQLREAGEAKVQVIQGRDEISRIAQQYKVEGCPDL